MTQVVPFDHIRRVVALLRGHLVMLSPELALLYGVEHRALVQAVKRNAARFPDDFVFQLSAAEVAALTSQSVISKPEGRGGARYLPYAFTEQGVARRRSAETRGWEMVALASCSRRHRHGASRQ